MLLHLAVGHEWRAGRRQGEGLMPEPVDALLILLIVSVFGMLGRELVRALR